MKPGKIFQTFSAGGGRHVVLRTPTWNDLDDLLTLINSLVEEHADIIVDEKVVRENEVEWLSRALARLEKDDTFYLVAEVDGRVVGNSEVSRKITGRDKHVGTLGIAIRNGHRDMGIGTAMMEILIDQSKTMSLKVLTLGVFATNAPAYHLYSKVGFVETGRIPNKFLKDGKYLDEIVMVKILE
jgi:ribosomal protein S18 acetylase RimI-like enzyme